MPKNTDWQLAERVCALLEKAISPEAQVQHDVKLKDIVTGRSRQFDVVIYVGKEPRQSITVVEVQKRNRKVGLPQLQSWCKKRESVDAQHLICVSTAGFTRPAMEEVEKKFAHTVRLMFLKELEETSWPFAAKQFTIRVSPHEMLIHNVRIDSEPPFPSTSFGENTHLQEFISTAIREGLELQGIHPNLDPGKHSFNFKRSYTAEDMPEVLICCQPYRIRAFETTLVFNVERHVVKLDCASYEQIDFEGRLAFAFKGQVRIGGKDVNVVQIVLQREDGICELGPGILEHSFDAWAWTLRVTHTRLTP